MNINYHLGKLLEEKHRNFTFGKKRAIENKILVCLSARFGEDPTSDLEGRNLERNPRFLSMMKGGE